MNISRFNAALLSLMWQFIPTTSIAQPNCQIALSNIDFSELSQNDRNIILHPVTVQCNSQATGTMSLFMDKKLIGPNNSLLAYSVTWIDREQRRLPGDQPLDFSIAKDQTFTANLELEISTFKGQSNKSGKYSDQLIVVLNYF